ncbi:MAG: DUF1622 domain-containing protein [Clostridia bacterium]|nr:DUF1622 domain-containing protein [Clostridia bacterium]
MEEVYQKVLSVFTIVIEYLVLAVELVGVVVLVVTVIRAIIGLAKRDKKVKLDLAEGIALALQFKMGGELLRTVIVREWSELLILGAVILLRAALTVLIQWEIKLHKDDGKTEEKYFKKLFAKRRREAAEAEITGDAGDYSDGELVFEEVDEEDVNVNTDADGMTGQKYDVAAGNKAEGQSRRQKTDVRDSK